MRDPGNRYGIIGIPVIPFLFQFLHCPGVNFCILSHHSHHHFRVSRAHIGKINRLTTFLQISCKNRHGYRHKNSDDRNDDQKLRKRKAVVPSLLFFHDFTLSLCHSFVPFYCTAFFFVWQWLRAFLIVQITEHIFPYILGRLSRNSPQERRSSISRSRSKSAVIKPSSSLPMASCISPQPSLKLV